MSFQIFNLLIFMSGYKRFLVMMFFIITIPSGCKKFVDTEPPVNKQSAELVYNSNASAISVINGTYTALSQNNSNFASASLPNLSMWLGLSADELELFNGASSDKAAYYANQYNATGYGTEFWNNSYPLIYILNSAIEGISTSSKLTPAVQKQLLGEAKFLRGIFYFQLANLYGDVPLALTSNYKQNAVIKRSSATEVFSQVISDLKEAKTLLNPLYIKSDGIGTYSVGTEERIKPNRSAAAALLARVYLNQKNWTAAEQEASEVISNSALYSLVALNDVFLKNSKEAIWQLQPVNAGSESNTTDGPTFIIPPTGLSSSNPISLSSSLLNTFEFGDNRRYSATWVDSVFVSGSLYYFPTKYKVNIPNSPVTEYTMLLRLGEQYLIRAEARAQQNKLPEAKADLNVIRSRAGLPGTVANSQSSLVDAIIHERQVELFSEQGHRWFDLKRTNTIDAVMSFASVQKGSTWQSFKQLFPIPLSDILTNQNLIQNNGY